MYALSWRTSGTSEAHYAGSSGLLGLALNVEIKNRCHCWSLLGLCGNRNGCHDTLLTRSQRLPTDDVLALVFGK